MHNNYINEKVFNFHNCFDMSSQLLTEQDQDLLLKEVGEGWFKFYKKNIFITGGTGFIGKWLTYSLISANKKYSLNCKITLLTRNPDAFLKLNPSLRDDATISLKSGDVRFFKPPNEKFDYIIHGANDIANPVLPLESYDVSCLGTRSMLDFAVKTGTRDFLLISSGAVYGSQPRDLDLIPEYYSGFPERNSRASVYGLGKVVSEWLASEYARKNQLDIKIARCFSFVGQYLPMDRNFAIGNFIKDACDGDVINIQGDGSPVRTYLYAADLTVWLWKILLYGDCGEAYNVGGTQKISIEELAYLVRKLLNPSSKVEIKGKKILEILPARYVPDVSKAKTSLGLKETVSLDESIIRTANWYMNLSKSSVE